MSVPTEPMSRCIGPGPWKTRRPSWISEGPLALAIDILFWFFSYLFLYFQLFLSLFKYVIWTFCCTRNKAFMKPYQWFYWNSNLQFWEKSQPVPGAPKQSCCALQIFSWRPWVPKHWLLGGWYQSNGRCIDPVIAIKT